jgi:hypothetical protein
MLKKVLSKIYGSKKAEVSNLEYFTHRNFVEYADHVALLG